MRKDTAVEVLLTAKEVAAQLKIKPRTVRSLGLPCVVVGRLIRYRQEDVDSWIASHTEYRGQVNGSREKTKGRIVGLSVYPTRALLQRIRHGNAGGSQGGRDPV